MNKKIRNNQNRFSPTIEKLDRPFIMYTHWIITLHQWELWQIFSLDEAEKKYWELALIAKRKVWKKIYINKNENKNEHNRYNKKWDEV